MSLARHPQDENNIGAGLLSFFARKKVPQGSGVLMAPAGTGADGALKDPPLKIMTNTLSAREIGTQPR